MLTDLLKNYGTKALPYVALLVVGVLLGWYVKPSQMKTTTTEHTTTKEVQVTTDAEKLMMQQISQLQTQLTKMMENTTDSKYHKEVLETTAADGSKTKKTTIDKNVDSHTVEHETQTQVQIVKVEVEKQVLVATTNTVEKEVTKIVVKEPVLAQWHVGALVGIKPTLSPFGVGNLQVGAEVERRILGPFFLGVGVIASPSKFDGVQVMGKLGFEF